MRLKYNFIAIIIAALLIVSGCSQTPDQAQDHSGKGMIFENGMAMPMLVYSDITASNETSDILRFCVYVETDHDTDGDGMADLVKAFVQLPKSAALGKYKAAAIYDPTPYPAGVVENMDALLKTEFGEDSFDKTKLYAEGEKRTSASETDTMTAALNSDSSQWIYEVPGTKNAGYYNSSLLDYFLIRGFAVVQAGGIGTYGSEGYELCGSDLERDSHKAVVEWLAGNRRAFTDKESCIEIKAGWCNGNVAMTGCSYGGTLPFEVATTGVEGLKTIIPFAGIANWYLYTNSQGVSITANTHYSDILAAYNSGSLFLDDAWLIPNMDYVSCLRQQRADEENANGNFDETWAASDYSHEYENIQCSALIFHGLNDFNVLTSQSELIYQAFKNASQNVKVVLHQDGHNYFWGKYVDSQLSDELVNKWLCHYLYDIDNGIESMPELTVQSNIDGSFYTLPAWDDLPLSSFKPQDTSGEKLINTRDLDPVIQDYVDGTFGGDRYYRDLPDEYVSVYQIDVPEGSSISRTPQIKVRLRTEDADQDNLMVTALLMDETADGSAFEVYQTSNDFNKRVPVKTVGSYYLGDGHEDSKVTEFVQSYAWCHAFSFGWIDLLDPQASEKNPALDTQWHTAQRGEYSEYNIVLTPTEYTLAPGHILKLYIFAQDPLRCRNDDSSADEICLHKTDPVYSFTIDNTSVEVMLPIRE